MRSNSIVSQDTLVPLGFIFMLAGGIVWITSIYAQGNDNTKSIQKIEVKQEDYNKTVNEVNSRLSRIEGALGVKNGR